MPRYPKPPGQRGVMFANAETAIELERIGESDEWTQKTLKTVFDLGNWTDEELDQLVKLLRELADKAARENEIQRRTSGGYY